MDQYSDSGLKKDLIIPELKSKLITVDDKNIIKIIYKQCRNLYLKDGTLSSLSCLWTIIILLVSYFMGNNIRKKETYLPLLIYIVSPLILYLIYNLGITFIAKIGNFECEQKFKILLCLFCLLLLIIICNFMYNFYKNKNKNEKK